MADGIIQTDKDLQGGFTSAVVSAHSDEASLTELQRRFDVYVDMDENATAPKGTTMATSALCGCIAGYIENPGKNTFFHYGPASLAKISELIESHVTDDTLSVHLIMPGDDNGNPLFYYVDEFLRDDIEFIEGKGIDPKLHSYSVDQNFEDRYEGTAWIDEKGALLLENEQIYLPKAQTAPLATKINKGM